MAWALPDGCVLGLWSEWPTAASKPKLVESLGEGVAATLADAAFFDRLDLWGNPQILADGGRRVVVFTPAEAGPWFDERVPEQFSLQPQEAGDLDARLLSFFEGEFAEGAAKVVVLIGDAPTLDPTMVVSAFLCLDNRDIVIGPRTDGGLYLIGLRAGAAPQASDFPAGNALRLASLVELLIESGKSLAVLPPWYGFETGADWTALRSHLRALMFAGMRPGLPRLELLANDPGVPDSGLI